MQKWLLLFFGLLFSTGLGAQSGGKGVFAFLNLSNSAHVAALGGNNVSLVEGQSDFAFHNPALLSQDNHKEVNLNYVNYFAGIKFGYASYAHHIDSAGTFGFGIHYVNYGKFIAADAVGYKTGEFSAADYALNLFWSKQFFENFRFAINLKPIYSQMESYTSYAIAGDIGAIYHKEKSGFSAGLTFKNIGHQIKPYYSGAFEALPFDLQAGVSQRLAHAPFRVSLTAHHLHKWNLLYDKPEENTVLLLDETAEDPESGQKLINFLDNGFRHAIVSVEFIPHDAFYAAISYNHLRRQELSIYEKPGMVGFSFGFGLKLKKFGISYGRQSYHLAGGTNHFSFYLNINEFNKI